MVLRPVELISDIDQNERAASYSPISLAGNTISERHITASDIEMVLDIFLSNQRGERKRQFKERLLVNISRMRAKQNYISKIVEENSDKPIFFYSYSLNLQKLEVGFFRSTNSRYAPTVIRSVLLNLIREAAANKVKCINIKDNNYSSDVRESLVQLEFIYDEESYVSTSVP